MSTNLILILKMTSISYQRKYSYLLKPGTSQSEPKPAKTSWNQPKQPEASRNDPQKLRNDQKFWNWGNLEFPTSFRYLNFEPKAQIWAFWDFLILTTFCMYSILNVLIANLSFVLENFEPKSPNLGVLGLKVLTF